MARSSTNMSYLEVGRTVAGISLVRRKSRNCIKVGLCSVTLASLLPCSVVLNIGYCVRWWSGKQYFGGLVGACKQCYDDVLTTELNLFCMQMLTPIVISDWYSPGIEF